MPRANYGNAVKQRAIQFFTVLVDYANDELDCDDRRLEYLQRDIRLHWQTAKRCVVRTKVRHLAQLMQLAGSELTSDQIKESLKCLTDFIGIIEDNRPSKGGSETWHFTLTLWYEKADRSANLDRLASEWERRKSAKPASIPESIAPTNVKIDWLALVHTSLTDRHYHRVTTNQLMVGDELKFSLDEVYIPLGLLERQPPTVLADREDRADEGELSGTEIVADADCLLAQLLTSTGRRK